VQFSKDPNSFQTRTITLDAFDAEQGRVLITAGDKPRLILGLNAYDGTNTAAASFCYGIMNLSPEETILRRFTTANGMNPFITLTKSSSNFGSSFTVHDPDYLAGTSPKSNGVYPGMIIPPGHAFCVGNRGANMDGTIIVNISTAEVE